MNWREIATVGYPTDDQKCFVTDGKNVSISDGIDKDGVWLSEDSEWWRPKPLDIKPTHWAPIYELELPGQDQRTQNLESL